MLTKNEMLTMLKTEAVPAFGCTEPVCVSLAAADAAKNAGGKVLSIEIEVNPNIFKNGMSVGIPGFDKVGLDYAAALGAMLKNPEKQLQLLQDITDEVKDGANKLVKNGKVKVDIKADEMKLYVKCKVKTDNGESITTIRDAHTAIVSRVVNEKEIFNAASQSGKAGNPLSEKLAEMTVKEIRELVESFSYEELAFLEEGITMNEEVAQKSIAQPHGVGISSTFNKVMGTPVMQRDLMSTVMQKVASAIESRLDGCPYTIMASSGAGSKGLAVILPIAETAKLMGADKEKTVKALAFAHMLNSYINAHIGKLSAMCACGMAASTAAAAGMTYLRGGDDRQIAWTIRNMTGSITGMICDGGKVGCALKLATASAAAVLSSLMAENNAVLRVSDGVCAETAEDCVKNLGRIANPGMTHTDKVVLQIMLDKQK